MRTQLDMEKKVNRGLTEARRRQRFSFQNVKEGRAERKGNIYAARHMIETNG